MAQLIIALRQDPATGKQNIIVKLDSDPDALPIEHERLHKALVEKLTGIGIAAEDLGHVIIEREAAGTPQASEVKAEETKAKAAQANPFSPRRIC